MTKKKKSKGISRVHRASWREKKRKMEGKYKTPKQETTQSSPLLAQGNPPILADPSHISSGKCGASILSLPLQDVNFLVQVHNEFSGPVH